VADQIADRRQAAEGGGLAGGNGLTFDWRLLVGRWLRPWMLAGGLTPENVAQAVRLTGARQVDVSSAWKARRG
jgi:phosphoribosylanthranilate isomerase